MKTLLKALTALLLLSAMAQAQTAILGKTDIGVVRLTHLSGTALDSAVQTGNSADFLYEVTILSKSGSWTMVQFKELVKQTATTRAVKQGSTVTDIISNFRLVFHSTLTAGDRSRIEYTHYVPVKTDSTGALMDGLWNVARTDAITTLTGSAQAVLLNNDFPRGLTVIANVNMQFRTNRITNWIYLFAGGSIHVPIRHTAADTFYAKTATIPDVCIIRGK